MPLEQWKSLLLFGRAALNRFFLKLLLPCVKLFTHIERQRYSSSARKTYEPRGLISVKCSESKYNDFLLLLFYVIHSFTTVIRMIARTPRTHQCMTVTIFFLHFFRSPVRSSLTLAINKFNKRISVNICTANNHNCGDVVVVVVVVAVVVTADSSRSH